MHQVVWLESPSQTMLSCSLLLMKVLSMHGSLPQNVPMWGPLPTALPDFLHSMTIIFGLHKLWQSN